MPFSTRKGIGLKVPFCRNQARSWLFALEMMMGLRKVGESPSHVLGWMPFW